MAKMSNCTRVGFLVFFLFPLVLFLSGGSAFAETLELVTYYPVTATSGNQHLRSLTVGTDYNGLALNDGQAVIQTSLGIGPGFDAAPPAGVLHVVGQPDATSLVLFMPGADPAGDGTPEMRVGIGTANPQGVLDLGDATSGRSLVWGGSTGGANYNSIGSAYSSSALSLLHGLKLSTAADQYLYSVAALDRAGIRLGDASTGDITFFSAPSSTQTVDAVFTPNSANNTKLILKGSGEVGIGTTAPGALLQVGSRTGVDNKGKIRLAHKTGANNNAWDIGTGDATAGGTADDFYIFDSPNTTTGRLVIKNSTGNIGIGTTTPAAKARLDLAGDGYTILVPRKSTTGDPAASDSVNGMIYYNTADNKFRAYENGAWKDLISSAGQASWTPFATPLSIGTLPITPTTSTLAIPASVPTTAKEILVYVRYQHGDSGTDRGTDVRYTIYTQSGGTQYVQQLNASSTRHIDNGYWDGTSANFWLPYNSSDKNIYVKLSYTITGNVSSDIQILGYR